MYLISTYTTYKLYLFNIWHFEPVSTLHIQFHLHLPACSPPPCKRQSWTKKMPVWGLMNHLCWIDSRGRTKTSLGDRRTKPRFGWIPQNNNNHNLMLNKYPIWTFLCKLYANWMTYPAGQPPLSLRIPFLVNLPPSAILNSLKVGHFIWDIIWEKFDLRIQNFFKLLIGLPTVSEHWHLDGGGWGQIIATFIDGIYF